MTFVLKIKNTGNNLSSWQLNGILNSKKIDFVSFNPFSSQDPSESWQAIPDIWLDHKKWTERVIFETYHNLLLEQSFQKNLISHKKNLPQQPKYPPSLTINDRIEEMEEEEEDENFENLILKEKEEICEEKQFKGKENVAIDMSVEIFDSFCPKEAKEEFINLKRKKQRVLSEVPKFDTKKMPPLNKGKIVVDLNDYGSKILNKKKIFYKKNFEDSNKKRDKRSKSSDSFDTKKSDFLSGRRERKIEDSSGQRGKKRSISSSKQTAATTPNKVHTPLKKKEFSIFPFKISLSNFEKEFEYFQYLQSKYFCLYFEVFKECVKSNFDIFKFLNQSRVVIKFSLLDLSADNYRKSWLQLQKLKTRYPFIKIFLEVDEEVIENLELLRLFKAENMLGVSFCGLEFGKVEGKKVKILNKKFFVKVKDFIEEGYFVEVEVEEVETGVEKFSYLDGFRKGMLKKISEARKIKLKLANSVVRQIYDMSLDLPSSSYSLYEKDRFKYISYEKAIFEKLKIFEFRKITIAIIGAARGGLLLATARALSKFANIVLDKIVLLEKNQNCKFSLKEVINKNPECKNVRSRTFAIFKDARKVSLAEFGGVKADLVISEMIEQTEYIPQKIVSFIEPIGGQPLVNQISEPNIPLLCTPRNFHFTQEKGEKCFVFDHKEKISLTQKNVEKLGLFHGFFGYFEVELSDSVKLTNYPDQANKLESWGPFYIPIDMTFVVEKDTKIQFEIVRNISREGVMWYEWKYGVLRAKSIEKQSGWFNRGGSYYRVFNLLK